MQSGERARACPRRCQPIPPPGAARRVPGQRGSPRALQVPAKGTREVLGVGDPVDLRQAEWIRHATGCWPLTVCPARASPPAPRVPRGPRQAPSAFALPVPPPPGPASGRCDPLFRCVAFGGAPSACCRARGPEPAGWGARPSSSPSSCGVFLGFSFLI